MFYTFNYNNKPFTVHPSHLQHMHGSLHEMQNETAPDRSALIVVRDKQTAERVRRWSWRDFKTKISRKSLGSAIPEGFAAGGPVFEVQSITPDGILCGEYLKF